MDRLDQLEEDVDTIKSELLGTDLSHEGGLIMTVKALKQEVSEQRKILHEILLKEKKLIAIGWGIIIGLIGSLLLFGYLSIKDVIGFVK